MDQIALVAHQHMRDVLRPHSIQQLVADGADHVEGPPRHDGVHEDVAVDPHRISRVKYLIFVLPCRVQNVCLVLDPLVPDHFLKRVFNRRAVRLCKVTFGELDSDSTLPHSHEPQDCNLPLQLLLCARRSSRPAPQGIGELPTAAPVGINECSELWAPSRVRVCNQVLQVLLQKVLPLLDKLGLHVASHLLLRQSTGERGIPLLDLRVQLVKLSIPPPHHPWSDLTA
mmetsp:Transcript_5654/g.19919  ORF Transcript_5654/g.19919 Transcript_5654/m.19919 type:complete len:227 (+) Transcript_5654:1056-1736(+)